MATITTTSKKNVVELVKDTKNAKLEHIIINGITVGIMGSVNETDRETALSIIQKAVDNSENVYDMMSKINQMVTIEESNINPDEEIEIDGEKYLINYTDRKIYNSICKEVANMNDIKVAMPAEAIKTILVDRVRLFNNK